MKPLTRIMTFGGKEYKYVLCPKCEVWIAKEGFKNGTHKNCKRYQRSLETRRLSEKMVLGKLNRYARGIQK